METISGVKIAFVQIAFPDFHLEQVFPWLNQMGKELDQQAFLNATFVQPDLFIRIRPGHRNKVIQQLSDQQIPFVQKSIDCIALPASSKLENVLHIDKEVVVQDASSQNIAQLLKMIRFKKQGRIQFWDCCAASGGKTILVQDLFEDLDITVSDIRPSILHNLSQRFQRAGIKYFHPIVTDLSSQNPGLPQKKFDLIFCDIPCSGSGTWGRTPEQLTFFTEDKIAEYQQLQKSIVSNLFSSIAIKGYLLYSTCSVFKTENEDLKDFILKQDPSLTVVAEKYLMGYHEKADTMYAVLFRKT
jgi:16S rRNA (cytosine967-C5)-methyltransferase